MTDVIGDRQRNGVAAGNGEPGDSAAFLPPDHTLDVSTPDADVRIGRAFLLEQREARLAAHLDAAGDALRHQDYTGAQEAVDRAAFLDPDDERVLRMMDRVDAACLRLVDRQVTRGRECLLRGALTEASGCVDEALRMHPASPEALQLGRDIETQLLIRRGIETAERCRASGELDAAVRAIEQVLAAEPIHEIALQLKKEVERALTDRQARAAVDESRRLRAAGDHAGAQRVLEDLAAPHDLVEKELASLRAEKQAARALADRRAQAAVDESRRKRAAGDFAGARRVLEGHAEPHDLVRAELASLSADMQRRQEEFDRLVNRAREQLQRERLHGASEPMREALHALGTDGGATLPAPAAIPAKSAPGSEATVPGQPGQQGRAARGGRRWLSRVAVIGLAFAAGWGWWLALSRDATRVDDDASLSASMVVADTGVVGALEERSGVTEGITAGPAETTVANGDIERAGPDIGVAATAGPREDRALAAERLETPGANASRAEQRLRAADVAFRSGELGRARFLLEEAFALEPSPEANRGLQRVANAEALACRDDDVCGVLVVRVTPAAEIFVNDLSMGSGTELQLRLPVARHRVRLETERWRFPRVTEIAAGEVTNLNVDLEQDGFIR